MFRFLGRKLHPSWGIVCFFIGIIVGAIIGLVFRVRFFESRMWVLVSVILLILVLIFSRGFILVFAVIAGMILIFFRISAELYGQDYIRQFYGQTILISGTVKSDPEMDEGETKIKLNDLKFGEKEISRQGNIYISARFNRKISRGDRLKISGKLTEGFGTFWGYMYKPTILEILRPEPGDLILKIRNFFSERIRRLIPEPEVNLGLSYLLGMRTGLPEDLEENLRLVGLVHIVVASGAHLSILVEIARKIFGRLSRFIGLLFSILFVLFFMSMVGWTSSILRAGVMAVLGLVTWYVGRKIAAWRIILITAAFTLVLNPNFLFDLGWLLSFTSFFGIMILGPILKEFFYDEKKLGFVISIVLTTISATLMTMPIILYFYGTVSLISVLANLLILPTLPYAMGLVFLTGVFAEIPIVGNAISFLATKLLNFHIIVVEFFGKMKSFFIEIPMGNETIFLMYGLILGVIMLKLRKDRKKLSGREKYVRT